MYRIIEGGVSKIGEEIKENAGGSFFYRRNIVADADYLRGYDSCDVHAD